MNSLLASASGAETASAAFILTAIFALMILIWVAFWRIFTKADEAGWKALIPIYNVIVLLRIVGRPWWWLLLYFIPIVGLVLLIIVIHDLSKSFGHGAGFTVGLLLVPPVFVLILAFGDSIYRGPAGPETAGHQAG
jgi:hypothetical protein